MFTKSKFNIENTLHIEQKLWSTLEAMRSLEQKLENLLLTGDIQEIISKELSFKHYAEISKLAENWWETTHQDNLNDLE
jgi:hypothetical protein